MPDMPVKEPAVHRLEVQADEKTWIQVVLDGRDTESDLLQPGENREWKARESMRVVVGNGGGVRVKWNGKSIDLPNRRNRVVRFTLPEREAGRR